ncbi:hypothetical protein OF83DRAFT_1087323 [Amylostereum chailletii]|nr:hypothetical protein OF83DRAFT_1087323 [Amylostereum chailletii]
MPSLPAELLLDIFERAIHPPPQPIDMLPSANKTSRIIEVPKYWHTQLIPEVRKSLETPRVLCLVSRSFNVLATPFLYSSLYLNPASTPRILAALDAPKVSMVHHVVMDFIPHFPTYLNGDLASLFAILTGVRTLIVRGASEVAIPSDPFINAPLASAMGASLGQTLRQFAFVGDPLSLCTLSTFNAFITSFIHLTVLAVPSIRPGLSNPPSPDLYASILRPTLTHLLPPSLARDSVLDTPTPLLVSATLSGSFADLIRFLVRGPLPVLSEITFTDIGRTGGATWEAFMNTVGALPGLTLVRFMDRRLVWHIVAGARLGRIDMGVWRDRGFEVVDDSKERVERGLDRSIFRQTEIEEGGRA